MNTDRERLPSSWRGSDDGGIEMQPRVVLFDTGEVVHVEVLELSVEAAPGVNFRYRGSLWRVVEVRRSSRVIIARPEPH